VCGGAAVAGRVGSIAAAAVAAAVPTKERRVTLWSVVNGVDIGG
jgi:hypothetical protein